MMDETYDYRTEGARQRDALHEKVANLYILYRSRAENSISDNQIFNRIAAENNISSISVRNICLSKGVAQRKNV